MQPSIRQARPRDTNAIADVLCEAARWLEQRGLGMWRDDELVGWRIAADVESGVFFVAESDGEIAGVTKFQLEDNLFWPDLPTEESAFLHRLAVRRRFAGGSLSSALVHWAVERTRSFDRKYLRLDCEASRPKLRALYEKFGFIHHSDRQAGPYFVARYQYAVK